MDGSRARAIRLAGEILPAKEGIMKQPKIWATILAVAVLAAASYGAMAKVEPDAEGEEDIEARMQQKLEYAQGILEALALGDLGKVEELGNQLDLVTLQGQWLQTNPPNYAQHNADFHWAVNGLVEMAENGNLEGATLKYNQVVASCVSCHKAVRGAAQVADLSPRTR